MRTFRLALAALTVLSLMGADGSCQRVESDRPPQDRQVDPKRQRVVAIRVTEATGPYTVTVRAGEVGDRHMGEWATEDIAGGPWHAKLRYTSGVSIEIHLFVSGHASDRFGCKLEDGDNVDQTRGTGQVLCRLVTQR